VGENPVATDSSSYFSTVAARVRRSGGGAASDSERRWPTREAMLRRGSAASPLSRSAEKATAAAAAGAEAGSAMSDSARGEARREGRWTETEGMGFFGEERSARMAGFTAESNQALWSIARHAQLRKGQPMACVLIRGTPALWRLCIGHWQSIAHELLWIFRAQVKHQFRLGEMCRRCRRRNDLGMCLSHHRDASRHFWTATRPKEAIFIQLGRGLALPGESVGLDHRRCLSYP
jgi:hypothetical protein